MDGDEGVSEAIRRWRLNVEKTGLKKCSCGEEYFGNYNQCPDCVDAATKRKLAEKKTKVQEVDEVLEDIDRRTGTDRRPDIYD